jgi:XTP/dITP diphosphohydrolase
MPQEFDKLLEIMKKLRAECPWDKKQTHETLRQYLLEETYEVLETIDEKKYGELKSELGDLLLQIIFHSEIASEEGLFNINDVIHNINEKLIRRHPHVFGNVKVNGAEDVKKNWEVIKKSEGKNSVLDGVPKELPALLRANRIQEKASHVGFDWKNSEDVWKKIEEELKEFKESLRLEDKTKVEEEFGDLLFSLVNYSRFIGINSEDALRKTIEKFVKRFQYVESEFDKKNKKLEDSTLEEMDKIWEKSKMEI